MIPIREKHKVVLLIIGDNVIIFLWLLKMPWIKKFFTPVDNEGVYPNEIHVAPSDGTAGEFVTSELFSSNIDEVNFSFKSLKKYLNPKVALPAFGRGVKETFKEYWKAETVGTVTAVSGALLANAHTAGWLTAAAGALSEDVGFYGTVGLERHYKSRKGSNSDTGEQETSVKKTAGSVIKDHWVAECVDKVGRTTLMFIGIRLASPIPWETVETVTGIAAGKFIADSVFYGIVKATKKVKAVRVAKKDGALATYPQTAPQQDPTTS